MFLVFDWGVFELGRGNREQIGGLGDRHGGNLGTDLLGEEDALLDRFGGEIRPVCRNQDVLEHYRFSPAPVSFGTGHGASWKRLSGPAHRRRDRDGRTNDTPGSGGLPRTAAAPSGCRSSSRRSACG